MVQVVRKLLPGLILATTLASTLAGCGSTPEPTVPPPTQTPWIVVVTATFKPEEQAQVQPTLPPTPTSSGQAEASPTETATARSDETRANPTETSPAVTVEPTQKGTATTPVPPEPTNTPEAAAFKYPPPVLLDPPDNRPVSWNSTVLLIWSSVGELAEDEFYHVHLERPPKTEAEQWYGDYVYTKDTEFLAEGAFLAPFHLPAEQGHGVVYWWVRVVRKTGEDANGKPIGIDIGAPSEKRTFITEPKPSDS
jgi:hypothetical protein